MLAPGADVEQVVISCSGIDGLSLADDGSLRLETSIGPLFQRAPRTWEACGDGETRPLPCRYRILSRTTYGFEVADRSEGTSVVIDPDVEWSTYVGSCDADAATAVFVQAGQTVMATGTTYCFTFPSTPGAYDPSHNGDFDVFVFRMRSTGDGPLIYATFLGGSGRDIANDFAITSTGIAIVVGATSSADFPFTAGALGTSLNGAQDAFVSRLSAGGSLLTYSTYLGGNGTDEAKAVAATDTSVITVAGTTTSTTFPTVAGSFDTTFSGTSDGFVTRFQPGGGPIVYSTFLGGSGAEVVNDIGLCSDGSATLTGSTSSTNFPTTPLAFDSTYNGATDAFVTRLNPAGSALEASTFLGGASSDVGEALAIEACGGLAPAPLVFVVGRTSSSGFPTTSNAFDQTFNSGSAFNADVFATHLGPNLGTPNYSTFIGGFYSDQANDVVLDDSGVATIVGSTNSSNFPVTFDAFQQNLNGAAGTVSGTDALVLRLDRGTAGTAGLLYSTYLGGTLNDNATAVGLSALDWPVVAGYTGSPDFYVSFGAFDTTHNGGSDVFVTRFQP